MARVVHFEIHAENPERAMTFYQTLFGWHFEKYGTFDYWLIKTGEDGTPGIDGGLMTRHGGTVGDAVTAYVCSVDVDDIDASIKAVEAAGGEILSEKNAIPGVGWNAYAKDTEGNIFGLFQGEGRQS